MHAASLVFVRLERQAYLFPLLGWGSRLRESLPREGLLCESKLKLPPSLLPGQPPQRPVTRPAALLRLRTDGDLCTFTPALQGPSWMPTTCHAAGTGLWERVLDKTHRILTAGLIKRKQMTVNPGLAPPCPPRPHSCPGLSKQLLPGTLAASAKC